MTTKEKVIIEMISRIKARLLEIDNILTARPIAGIFDARRKAHQIMKENEGDYSKIAKLIEPLAKEEKRLLKLAGQQKDMLKLMDEEYRLKSELNDLENEQFMERVRLKRQ